MFNFYNVGDQVSEPQKKCPICEYKAINFQKYGNTNRPDARCQGCGALERHRLLWLWLLKQKLGFGKVLHFAPEAFFVKKFQLIFGPGYITADLCRKANVKMDICKIDSGDSFYDMIFCSHVLEHVQDDRKAMSELLRVIKETGIVVLQIPITAKVTFEDPSINDPKERERIFGQVDHVRKYGPDFYDRLIESGFEVDIVRREDFLTPEEIELYAITRPAGELSVCRKPDKLNLLNAKIGSFEDYPETEWD